MNKSVTSMSNFTGVPTEAGDVCYLCTLPERLVSTDNTLLIFQPWNIVFLLLMVLFIVVARFLFQLKYDVVFKNKTIEKQGKYKSYLYSFNEALAEDDNKALAVSLAGYLLGAGLYTWSSFNGLRLLDGWANVYIVIIWQIVGAVQLEIARLLNDKVAFGSVNNAREIVRRRNLAVGLCEGGSYVAAGQVVMAATTGESHSWSVDIASSFMWFFIGQIIFLIVDKILARVDDLDIQDEVKKGNVAMGLYFAMSHINIGLIISNVVFKSDSILAFFVWVIVGTVGMLLLRVFIYHFVLPGSSLHKEIVEDHNWGTALVYGIIPIGVSIYLNTFLPNTCENST